MAAAPPARTRRPPPAALLLASGLFGAYAAHGLGLLRLAYACHTDTAIQLLDKNIITFLKQIFHISFNFNPLNQVKIEYEWMHMGITLDVAFEKKS